MRFLDPTIDVAFKRVFGNQAHPEIVISFLNNILELPEGEKITSVVIGDPYNQPESLEQKLSIVDVRCTDQKNRQFMIEVQAAAQKDYPVRSQYYAALAMARQLPKGAHYRTVMPVIFVGVLNFKKFESPEYLSTHIILNKKTHEHALRHMSFTFIELPKFNKTLEQLETVADKWIYLLKHAAEFDNVPKQLKNPHELDNALDLLNQGTMSTQELDLYDARVDERHIAESIMETAMETALERGMERGMEKGMEKGAKKAMLTLATRLLKTMSLEEVSALTDVPIDELKNLKPE